MTASAREWGITILRIWMGLLMASTGLEKTKYTAVVQLLSFWNNPLAKLGTTGVPLLLLLGGTAILLGIAVRVASLCTAFSASYLITQSGISGIGSLVNDSAIFVTFLVASATFLLTGPGRLNLGAAFARRR